MPSPSSTSELLDLVRKSGIVGPEALDGRFHEVHGLSGDPVQSAAVLVQKGVITRFQAKLLLTGRYRGFKLGPYVIREQLGQGGMGAVYLAEHEALRRKVALKVLTPPKDDPNAKLTTERFLREARSAAALDHPNIVRIHDVSHQGEVQFLALEYVDGQTLEDMLTKGGPIAPARAVGFIAQAAAGLQHAHEKGFVHRDIKPSNLILAKDGTVKILDMGLARSHSTGDKLTEVMDQGAIVGTADFISPEQAMNAPNIDIRADIYSLGATFFALVAGRPPFSGNTTQKLIQHQMKDAPSLGDIDRTLPPELSAVVTRMLSKKPEKRYATPAEVITALAPWLGEDGRKVAAGLATSEAANSSVELQNTMSEIATGGTTRRLNKKSRRLGTTDDKSNQKVYAAAGLAVTVAVVMVAWAVLGGDEKPAVAAVGPPTAVEPPAKTTPPKAAPKSQPAAKAPAPKTQPVSVVRPAATGATVYRFDTAQLPAGQFSLRGKDVASGRRIMLPEGHNLHCFKPDTVGDFVVEATGGQTVLGLGNREGASSTQWAIDLTLLAGDKLRPDGEYGFRIEYMTTEGANGHAMTQNREKKWGALGPKLELPNTGGKWQTATGTFRRAGTDPVQLALNAAGTGKGFVYFRTVEVTDPTAGPRALYDLDLSAQQPFEMTGRVDPPVGAQKQKKWVELSRSGLGQLPAGWAARPHNVMTVSRFRAEAVDGTMALGMESVSGPRSGMMFLPPLDFPDGKCQVRMEYKAEAAGREFKVRFQQRLPQTKAAWDAITLPVGDGTWQTADFEMDLKGGTGGIIELHDVMAGTLWVRKVTVLALEAAAGDKATTVGPSAPKAAQVLGPVGKSIHAIKLTTGAPFKFTVEDRKPSLDPATVMPNGVQCHCWKNESVAEFRGEAGDGWYALGVTNLNGELSSQMMFGIEDALAATAKPGQKFRVRLEYRTKNDAQGKFQVRGANYEPVAGTDLPGTGGAWRTAEVTITRGTDKLDTVVMNEAVGEGNTLYVRSFEVFEQP